MNPEEFLAGEPVALAVYERVRSILVGFGSVDIRTSKSQIAFRCKRGYAYIWRPTQYLGERAAPVVLTIVLGRRADSPRFKEVVHPAPAHWMHHLELRDAAEVDDEVRGWLAEAAGRAG